MISARRENIIGEGFAGWRDERGDIVGEGFALPFRFRGATTKAGSAERSPTR